jgi:hypothetical protein
MTASMTWVRGLRSTFELPIFEETHNRALARMGLRVVHHSKIRPPHVRFGSKADISLGPTDVRFTPKSGHRNSVA